VNSIRYKVLFVLIAACLIPSVVLLWVTNRITGEALEDSEYAKLQGVGAEVARQVESSMEATDNNLELLRNHPVLQNRFSTEKERVDVMISMVSAFKRFSDITIYSPSGLMTETTTPRESHPEPNETTTWFELARDSGKIVTSRPHRVNGVSGLQIKVYIPVHIEPWDQPHVLKARVPFESVWSRIEGAKLGEAGMIVLLDSRGNILYHPDKTKILSFFDGARQPDDWQANRRSDYVDAEGTRFIYWAKSIKNTHVGDEWTLVSLLPREEVNAAIRHSQLLQLLIGCFTVFVAMAVGVWLAHGFASPLILASDAAEQVAGGNLMARLPEERGSTEIRRLSLSFNMMIDEVREHRNKLSSLVERRTRKLRDSEMRLKKTSAMLLASYEATQEAVLVVDPDGYIVAANGHFGAFFGLESETLPGRSIADLECSITQCFETPEVFRGEWKQLIQDPYAYLQSDWNLVEPEPRSLSIYSAPVSDREGVLCARLWMFRDTSEQHRLQLGLQQAQKMEAVGRLAGGVAHDFNNLLTGIIGNLSLAQIGTGPDGETPEELVEVAKGAGERAAELVKQLLGFSRRTHLKVIIGDCNKVLSDVDLLTRRTIDPRIKIEVDQEPNLWGAKVDLNMIEQVVMNMVVNAKDAMPGAGTISMRTRNVTLEAEQLSENVRAAPGDYIAITVADNGEGMPPEVLQKVYEPFFTTKEQGKGTGLGLATSYGIIRQHEGWIDCVSKVGEGTVFNIYLPKAAETADVEPKKVPEAPIVDRGGSETILLVDDEKVVRTVAQSVLKHHGYNTLAAEDGLVALEHFARDQEGIDLVLLDLTMPNLSGADTFKRIRAEYGDVPVIVCSGYAVNLDEFEAENGARPNGFVQKPYNIADLAQRVREVLNEACLTA
jgi:two-component system cell cycle sensor histidine kinase/response regulator CckA